MILLTRIVRGKVILGIRDTNPISDYYFTASFSQLISVFKNDLTILISFGESSS